MRRILLQRCRWLGVYIRHDQRESDCHKGQVHGLLLVDGG